jgi:hypothetical protein
MAELIVVELVKLMERTGLLAKEWILLFDYTLF